MSKKHRKRQAAVKHTLIISTIVIINLMGMSYAQWNDSLKVKASFDTGKMEPAFDKSVKIEGIKEGRMPKEKAPKDNKAGQGACEGEQQAGQDVKGLEVIFDNDYTLRVEGEIRPNTEGTIEYGIINKGTIPIKYGQPQLTLGSSAKDNDHPSDGLDLSVSQNSAILETQKSSQEMNNNPRLSIKAREAGIYDFEIKLPFQQWNKLSSN